MSDYGKFDFNADPQKNWLNTIIWQIKICEETIFNGSRQGSNSMVYSMRGLFALLDETAKNKFSKEIQLFYDCEYNRNLIKSYAQIEHVFSDLLTYLNATIFREMRGVKPRNPTPDHIGE